MTLGNAIKLVRTATGIKQGALAKKLNVSANYLSLIENGRREPSISFLRRLASALGVPVGIFFLWQEINPMKSAEPGLDRLRELLTRLEAVYLLGRRQKVRSRRRAA
ncbi:MAG: helix-turn-helix transcriptional regulator [Candidatus Acidiferrum sp.]